MTITDSKCYQTIGGTSLTGTVTAAEGDIVLATITTRAATTLPAGWTQLYYSDVFDTSQGQGQRMYMIYKVAESAGTVSCQVQQATSQRLYINLISVAGVGGVSYHGANIETGTSISAPDKNSGDMIIWGCSVAYWNTSAPYGNWQTSPSDLTLVSLDQASYQPRNGNFIDTGAGAATGRAFTLNSISAYPITCAGVKFTATYEPSGTAVYTSTDIQVITEYADSKISWTADIPEDTTVTVSAVCASSVPDDEDYLTCTSGDPIPGLTVNDDLSTMTLYIKVALSTEDNTVTPRVSALSIRVNDVNDASIIRLTLDDLKRFHNVVGNLTVAYDATKGTLAGLGGPVESFSVSFTPEDLVAKPHQNDAENIEISNVTAEGNLIRIYYTDSKSDEHVELSNITAVGVLTHINDL